MLEVCTVVTPANQAGPAPTLEQVAIGQVVRSVEREADGWVKITLADGWTIMAPETSLVLVHPLPV